MQSQAIDFRIVDSLTLDSQAVVFKAVHITVDRVRFRIPRLADDPAYCDRLYYLVTNISGVTEARINSLACSLIVHHNPAILHSSALLFRIENAISQSQYPILLPQRSLVTKSTESFFQRLGVPVLGLSLALLAAPLELPIPALLLGGITIYAAIPLFTKAAKQALHGEISGDVLESLWTLLHSWHGEFLAPNLDITISATAQLLRDATGQEITTEWRHLIPMEMVHVERDGREKLIPVDELECYETIFLYPGEMSPIDGIILNSEGLLDVSAITEELIPLPCYSDEKILAGSLVIEGKLQVLIERLENDTEYSREAHLADLTPHHKTEIAEYAEEVGKSFMLPTMGLAGALFLLTGDVLRSLAPLQLDLATGISISAPTAMLCTIEQAKQLAIYVRSGYALETLTKADVIIFSKTGTLTQGMLAVVAVEPVGIDPKDCHAITESELLSLAASDLVALAASVKRGLRHPVAEAIVRHAQNLDIEIFSCQSWKHDQNNGLGVSAVINGSQVLAGSRRYLEAEGIDLAAFPDPIHLESTADVQGMWYVYVSRDGKLLGRIDCCDEVRPESREVIAALRDRGLEVRMVTSNSQIVAHTVADWLKLPLEFVHAELSSEAKMKVLNKLQAEGKTVVYFSEGSIDDYAPMQTADVAIGTNRSCPLNREMADLLLPYGDLNSLLIAFNLAEEAIGIINQNIALIAVPNISIVLLGIIFALDPIFAVILNQSANLFAELNSLRPLLSGNNKS